MTNWRDLEEDYKASDRKVLFGTEHRRHKHFLWIFIICNGMSGCVHNLSERKLEIMIDIVCDKIATATLRTFGLTLSE